MVACFNYIMLKDTRVLIFNIIFRHHHHEGTKVFQVINKLHDLIFKYANFNFVATQSLYTPWRHLWNEIRKRGREFVILVCMSFFFSLSDFNFYRNSLWKHPHGQHIILYIIYTIKWLKKSKFRYEHFVHIIMYCFFKNIYLI